ncbi:programmed cell death protein 7 [Cololabis saira]|uniref:programmed cell death protein 7 n=1 Tax=Cololabis saira TaxID=129043 RepID=UPI002AD55AB6|nr:programmed cell death protein 7 [Cololabis saira]
MDGRYEHPGAAHPPPYEPYPPRPAWPGPPPFGPGAGFGAPGFPPPPFGFDPSVPPPPFACPPHLHAAAPLPPSGPAHAHSSAGGGASFQRVPQDFSPAHAQGSARYDRDRGPERHGGAAPDESALQRGRDRQWLQGFLEHRGVGSRQRANPPTEPTDPPTDLPALRDALHGAAQLVTRLEELCLTLKGDLEDGSAWPGSYSLAVSVRAQLQQRLDVLTDPACLPQLRARLARAARSRSRRRRARKELRLEQELAEQRRAEKEAAIEGWRLKQVQQVEERKKELELKRTADAVLCEVRRKQADVKRMQDVLRSLEKLRKLRKEAASRKGIVTEQQCDEQFSGGLERLRSVIKSRTAVYSAEEKALMVMLEGEQEEERRREREKRVKKERERELQRRRRVTSMLFGEELPADRALQPFIDYYSQAEHSLQALIRVRSEWDAFLVAADNPDGSSVPETWVLPEAPSDRAWASALEDTDAPGL